MSSPPSPAEEARGWRPSEVDLLPSDEDVAFYREHGYYVSEKILPGELIEEARQGVERHFAGDVDDPLPVTTGFSDWRPGDNDHLRNIEHLALRNRQVRRLALSPLIGAIAARLAGAATIRLWDDQLVWKAPVQSGGGDAVIGWHTDRAYWMTCTSQEMLTAWIPFDDCGPENGPLMVVDGSHRWSGTEGLRSFNASDLRSLAVPLEDGHLDDMTRRLSVDKGQVSFHHCRTIHGSEANRADTPRVSLAVHLQDGANRWREYRNPQGVVWEVTNDRMAAKLADGTPDYTDPAVFPVLWSLP